MSKLNDTYYKFYFKKLIHSQLIKEKALNISLWLAQFILGITFTLAGFMKTALPISELSKSVPWTADLPLLMVRFTGICELLAGIGLILPALLKIKPILTPVAAIGIIIIMLLATAYHIFKGENYVIPLNTVFALVAVFIAWGRFKKVPILPGKKKAFNPHLNYKMA